MHIKYDIRWPPLGGVKAAGLDLIAFFTISSHCYSAIRVCFCVSRAQIPGRFPPPDTWLRIRYITKNPFVFKPVFKAKKIRKTVPKAVQKRQKSIPIFIKTDFHENSIFEILSIRKPRFGSPKHRDFDSEIDKKMSRKQPQNQKTTF